jgi:hypothetical protein
VLLMPQPRRRPEDWVILAFGLLCVAAAIVLTYLRP